MKVEADEAEKDERRPSRASFKKGAAKESRTSDSNKQPECSPTKP